MTDELKLRRDVERGARAKAILDDPLVQEAFARFERWHWEKFVDTPQRDHEGVIELHRLSKSAKRFRRFFEDCIRGMDAAEKQMEEKRRGIQFLGDVWPSRRPRRP